MAVVYEERLSDSPFVQTVWHTQAYADGVDVVAADGSWDMIVLKQNGKLSLTVWGAMTMARPVPHAEGSEYLGIRFKLGTLMTYVPIHGMPNTGITLPEAAGKSFWLGGAAWQFPDFENADTFIDRLVRDHLLVRDPVVDAALAGHSRSVSSRTIQRHIRRATGLTHNHIFQIERAQRAAALLQQGQSIVDTVFAAGYADQAHLTRALKRFVGQTPAQIIHRKT
jgi:AraC-like DNA-binding protein